MLPGGGGLEDRQNESPENSVQRDNPPKFLGDFGFLCEGRRQILALFSLSGGSAKVIQSFSLSLTITQLSYYFINSKALYKKV